MLWHYLATAWVTHFGAMALTRNEIWLCQVNNSMSSLASEGSIEAAAAALTV